MKCKTLTKGEMAIMAAIWQKGAGCTVYDVLETYQEPKPAYTTVATFMKILETKGFLKSKKMKGRSYTFFPTVTMEEYSRVALYEIKQLFFGGSAKLLIDFIKQEEKNAKDMALAKTNAAIG